MAECDPQVESKGELIPQDHVLPFTDPSASDHEAPANQPGDTHGKETAEVEAQRSDADEADDDTMDSEEYSEHGGRSCDIF